MKIRLVRRAALLAAGLLALAIGVPATGQARACRDCHETFTSVLPAKHPKTGNTLGACLTCHKPKVAEAPVRNAFAVAMHRPHVKSEGGIACTDCHAIKPKGKLGVVDGKVQLVADKESFDAAVTLMKQPTATTVAAGRHAQATVSCSGCHGPGVPAAGAEVANDRCLACHGPMDKLVAKTRPAQFADRNPHQSHLGDIACTTCHRGHEPSTVYCLDCHPKFQMKMRGS
jgi:formate-dependent nitrite reductase cytochrome c552 subunit